MAAARLSFALERGASLVAGVREAFEVRDFASTLAHLGVHRRLPNELLLEIPDVGLPAQLRLERGVVCLLVDLAPIQVLEERMRLHFLSVGRPTAQALLWVPVQQPLQEVLADRRNVAGVGQLPLLDALEELLAIAGVEGRQAREHLVGEGADRVPIDGSSVPLPVHDLGRQVLGRAAHGLRRDVVLDPFLAQPEICDLDVAIGVEEQVLRLQIAVDDAQAVQVCDGRGHLRRVEDRSALAEPACAAQVVEQLAPGAELHDHVELRRGLEGVVKRHDEGVRHGLQDRPLGLRVLLLVALDDVLLAEHLHRVHLVILRALHEHDLAIGALA
mmetsp:Transcript_58483/g.163922  ORF Transcript_58483/g.163922 Transcript_58483/m.163922 type:complete len:330 (+) Transcript_58483:68-1057(+)